MSQIGNDGTIMHAVMKPDDVHVAADFLEENGFEVVANWMRNLPDSYKVVWETISIEGCIMDNLDIPSKLISVTPCNYGSAKQAEQHFRNKT